MFSQTNAAMRILVIIVAVLAGLKIWGQDHLYRSGADAALIRAYHARAVETCRTTLRFTATRGAGDAVVEIGNPAAEVAFWDWQNPLWAVRFRHPHLVLKAERHDGSKHQVAGQANGQAAVCHYDLVLGTARTPVL